MNIDVEVQEPLTFMPSELFFGRIDSTSVVQRTAIIRITNDALPISSDDFTVQTSVGGLAFSFRQITGDRKFWTMEAVFDPQDAKPDTWLNTIIELNVKTTSGEVLRRELPVKAFLGA